MTQRIWKGERKISLNKQVNGIKDEIVTRGERWNRKDINWETERDWQCIRVEIQMI